ncbi:hypothetical protein [Phaeodactylibacter sp.]|uniref:hypothetical protein n=1 Tax=Phaeodactylibacter sp. TaxID=1940289 RepID=UPI0025F3EA41|nr:hypothetical protein [Phaeodactylibacter sp.]MCI4647521.1 hypothetical protein [Phaeodactylibacter sp.]MCI5094432.1 hypothetical protein [Phaeodactylibacter sp.]
MSRLLIIVLTLSVILIQSCKNSFDDKDMMIINLYSVGDTLIFENDKGHYDSITIVSKEIRYNELSEGYSGNPQTCWIEYQTIPPGEPELKSFRGPQGDIYNQNKSFISATKWEDSNPARVEIKFGGFGGTLPASNSLRQDDNLGDHFLIDHYCYDCIGVDSTDIVQIIWTPQRGVVQYMKKNKTVWRLIE